MFACPSKEVPAAEDECLISQINVSLGPWQGVYFHFKEPGEIIFPLEKCYLTHLRNQGNRVMIIRCLEDFKLWAQTYLLPLENTIFAGSERNDAFW